MVSHSDKIAIQLMAALLVLLLLLAVPLTAFSTNDVYYVIADDAAGHEQSCPPHQICHNLSYYISQPDSYFTSDTTIIFLEGEHSFGKNDLVHVSYVHNLTLKGQGQWPVAGAEETVMQSTVIINCTRGRGGFYFATSHNITVEGLTVINCGGFLSPSSVFLEGEHSFGKNDLVHVSYVHNLTLKGQGQWPVAGAEETVMQSTVIINCTRGRGGFYFATSHNITVEGLTVINCGGFLSPSSVFVFSFVDNLFFHKNSIQHMTGYGILVYNSGNVTVTNCSYYHSVFCNSSKGGAVGIVYNGSTQYSNTGYTLELSHSNMTKCCNEFL